MGAAWSQPGVQEGGLSRARARRPCDDARVLERTATADGRRPLARRRGRRGGGGKGRCPRDARAHQWCMAGRGVVGGARGRPEFDEDDDGERQTASGGETRLARVRASQQAGVGAGGRGRCGGGDGGVGLLRGSRNQRGAQRRPRQATDGGEDAGVGSVDPGSIPLVGEVQHSKAVLMAPSAGARMAGNAGVRDGGAADRELDTVELGLGFSPGEAARGKRRGRSTASWGASLSSARGPRREGAGVATAAMATVDAL